MSPPEASAGYSGTPLVRKLGIRDGSLVALLDAPPGFELTLGALPPGARVVRSRRGHPDVTLWFVPTLARLRSGMPRTAALAGKGRFWICWPKRTSALAGDLSDNVIRDAGLAMGLVDYKVCAVDETWSALCFATRSRVK
ncbi:MAG: DUF3052 domain-containing protein [Candidatus Dormibacteria bacterium]